MGSSQYAGLLPGGATLAPGEAPLVGDRFMFSTAAFYMHTELVLTNRRLYAMRPNVILGLIPVGTARSNFPIENIAGVNAGTRFDFLGVIFGVVALLVGLTAIAIPNTGILGLLLVALGLASIVGAPKQAIEVMNSGGGIIRFPVSVFERGRTLQFADAVSEALAGSARHGEPRRAAEPPRSPSSGTADALRRLRDLRDQRLVTEEEYAAKRGEILSRL